MIVTYGRKCPKGYLPAYSVNTEQEAEELIARSCEMVYIESEGKTGYIANELEGEQTIENLYAFGRRLHQEYQKMLAERGQ